MLNATYTDLCVYYTLNTHNQIGSIQGVPKKRFDSSFCITHPKIIRFGNFFQLITCQLSPLSVSTNIIFIFIIDEWFVQNINISGKSQIFVFPGFGHIQISPKKSSDNVMSNFLDRFSICFLLQHSDCSQL